MVDSTNGKHEAVSTGTTVVDFLWQRAKKAWTAGIGGGVLAGSGVSVESFIHNGTLDMSAIGAAASAIAVGFVGAYVLVWFTGKNAD